MKRGKRGRKSSPKQSLNLPDLDNAKSAVLNSLPSVLRPWANVIQSWT